jgi:glycosyltransferase involved in cell wall biosynthesis
MIWLFAAALAVNLSYWVLIAYGLSRVSREAGGPEADQLPISIVIAARNEEKRIGALLAALEAQTHTGFEAVIVDDGSTDATAKLVEQQAAHDDRFHLIRISERNQGGKKRALAAGMEVASHDRLAFTDADCRPRPEWLSEIARHAHQEPDVVLIGYGPFQAEPGALNALARYETWITAILTAAAVGLGRAYMAVGRNLSYPRNLFERVRGFESHLSFLSGDDDLLVQSAQRQGAPVVYMLSKESFVSSRAPDTWRAWIRQKVRHTSTGRHYDRGTQLHLTIFHVSNLAVWISPLFLGWTGGAILAVRVLIQRGVLRRAEEAFHVDHYLMIYQPLLDIGYLLYNTLLAPAGVLFGGRKW